jgi:biopolymer transport protein ExbD
MAVPRDVPRAKISGVRDVISVECDAQAAGQSGKEASMARRRRFLRMGAGELNLTAMIDVAFQLLAFFIVTIQPVDVFAHINAFRPSGCEEPGPGPAIRITVYPDTYTINENRMDFEELRKVIGRLGVHARGQTVLLLCRVESRHRQLIDVLDLCAQAGLTNLSVVSSP